MDTFGPVGWHPRPTLTPAAARLGRAGGRLVAALALAWIGPGCRTEMYDQPRYEPLEASATFSDGTSARPLVLGTVAAIPPAGRVPTSEEERERLTDPAAYEHFYEGRVGGEPASTFPFDIERDDLLRGREKYMVYCSPCHGATGDGRGMIVQRGFPPPPPFFGRRPTADTSQAQVVYDDLRQAPVGHFFDVITHGRGAMYAYDSRVAPADRWRIIAYVRALQLSQYAAVDELPAEEVARVRASTSGEQDLPQEAPQ